MASTELDHGLEEREEQGLPLREYWNTLLKRLWTVVLTFVLVVTAAGLYTFKQPKIYEATTTVIIDLEPPKVQAIDQSAYQMPWFYADSYFETQLKVIQSRKVAERVVRDEGLAENLAFLGLEDVRDVEKLTAALEDAKPADTLMALVSVEPVPDTRIVKIHVQHQDPEMAALLANAIAEAYRDQNSEHRVHAMQDAFHWLETQYKAYETRLNESGAALTEFKEQNPLLYTSPADQQVLTNSRLEGLNMKLIEVEDERRRTGYALRQLKRFKVSTLGVSGLSQFISNAEIGYLNAEYIKLMQSREDLLTRYLESSKEVKSLDGQIALVQEAIEQEVKSIRKGYQARYDALSQSEKDLRALISEVEQEALQLDQLKLLYEQVESQKAEQQRLFELVQRRLNEVSLTKLLETENIQILDEATVPVSPIKPRVMLNILLGVLAGLALGIVFAFLLEMLDTTVKTQEDIEKKIGLPFLGVIPSISTSEKRASKRLPKEEYRPYLHVKFFPKSSVAECARTVRANILFMSPNRDLRVLLVTSPSPLEGKTTTAINVATVMAQSASRVLLMEADMRRPRLHKAFGLPSEDGFSQVLRGQRPVTEVIGETGIENVDILVCGPIPPNPSELFHTDRFVEVLEELKDRYDHIIIDSPPVIAVSDALVLAQNADGVVVVSRAGKTQMPLLKRTKQLLEGINAPIIGAILNNVNLENRRYDTYYYYYYRHYGQYYEESSKLP